MSFPHSTLKNRSKTQEKGPQPLPGKLSCTYSLPLQLKEPPKRGTKRSKTPKNGPFFPKKHPFLTFSPPYSLISPDSWTYSLSQQRDSSKTTQKRLPRGPCTYSLTFPRKNPKKGPKTKVSYTSCTYSLASPQER